jgi:hypothetical protein
MRELLGEPLASPEVAKKPQLLRGAIDPFRSRRWPERSSAASLTFPLATGYRFGGEGRYPFDTHNRLPMLLFTRDDEDRVKVEQARIGAPSEEGNRVDSDKRPPSAPFGPDNEQRVEEEPVRLGDPGADRNPLDTDSQMPPVRLTSDDEDRNRVFALVHEDLKKAEQARLGDWAELPTRRAVAKAIARHIFSTCRGNSLVWRLPLLHEQVLVNSIVRYMEHCIDFAHDVDPACRYAGWLLNRYPATRIANLFLEEFAPVELMMAAGLESFRELRAESREAEIVLPEIVLPPEQPVSLAVHVVSQRCSAVAARFSCEEHRLVIPVQGASDRSYYRPQTVLLIDPRGGLPRTALIVEEGSLRQAAALQKTLNDCWLPAVNRSSYVAWRYHVLEGSLDERVAALVTAICDLLPSGD